MSYRRKEMSRTYPRTALDEPYFGDTFGSEEKGLTRFVALVRAFKKRHDRDTARKNNRFEGNRTKFWNSRSCEAEEAGAFLSANSDRAFD